MNILVVCQYYYPEEFKINDICEELVKKGHSVTVLTGLPNYPTGEVPNEYKWFKKRKEIINGVKIIRCLEIGRKSGVVGMALNYLSYMISSSIRALFLKKDFDIIYVYQLSPVTMALPGVILKFITKKPLYLYCCDIWPESMKTIISNEKNIAFKVIKGFSKFLYSQCDHITITSKPFFEYFNKVHSISLNKISYIPQHADESYLNMDFGTIGDIVDFVFMGNIGIAQDMDCILNAVEMIKDLPNFKVHFVGDGSYLKKSKELVKEKELENLVKFHGRHPIENMPNFYRIADVCLLTLKSDNLVGLTMPSKLQGYMAAGKPIVGAIDGSAQDVINEAKCGICVDSGDYKGLSNTMKSFIENPETYIDYGKNAKKYFEKHFTKEIFITNLENKLYELIEEKAYV